MNLRRISIAIAAVAVAGCRVAEGMPAQQAFGVAGDTAPGLEGRSVYRTWRDGECEFGWETANTRFMVVGSSAVEGQPHLVLEETTETRACDNHEGRDVKLRVTARPAASAGGPAAWTLAVQGDEGQVWFDHGYSLYRVRLFGCCDMENTDAFYDLRDGRLRFSSTTSTPLRLEVPGTAVGYVAFHGGNGAEPPPGRDADQTIAGVFFFAPDSGEVQRAILHGARDPYAATGFRLEPGEGPDGAWLYGRNGEMDGRPVRAVLTLQPTSGDATGPIRIEVPIENGRLAIDRAMLPAGMRLVPSPNR
jgi:hypothetical protein